MGTCCTAQPELARRLDSVSMGDNDSEFVPLGKGDGEAEGMFKLMAKLDEIWDQYDAD